MAELRGGSAGGLEGPSRRATIPPLTVTQAEVDAAHSLNKLDLESLLRRVIRSSCETLDFKPLLDLPLLALAKIGRTKTWADFIEGVMVRATIDRKDRYTKSQWRAIVYHANQKKRVSEIPSRQDEDFEVTPGGRA